MHERLRIRINTGQKPKMPMTKRQAARASRAQKLMGAIAEVGAEDEAFAGNEPELEVFGSDSSADEAQLRDSVQRVFASYRESFASFRGAASGSDVALISEIDDMSDPSDDEQQGSRPLLGELLTQLAAPRQCRAEIDDGLSRECSPSLPFERCVVVSL